jgi:zinc transporter ZupT
MGQEPKASLAATARPGHSAAPRAGGSSMGKALCWAALGTAGLIGLLFLLDLIAGFPFNKANWFLDILALLAAGIIIFVSIDTLREIK